MDTVGLAKLSLVDKIQVKSYYTLGKNKYEVRTEDGELLFNAKEEASGLDAWLGGKDRRFQFRFTDANKAEVITVVRPHAVFGHSYKVKVSIGGSLVSIVRQKPTFITPVLMINDTNGLPVLEIKRCQLMTLAKNPIGGVNRLYFGFLKELTLDGKFYNITFPRDLSLEYKAACIGACIYIDFKYYS